MGIVREANGGPLADVAIDGPEPGGTRRAAVTTHDGSFRIDQTTYDTLFFSKQDYYPALWSIYSSVPRDSYAQLYTITVRMQRKIFLSSGSSLSSLVTPDDVTYDGTASFPFGDVGAGYNCSPCKLISLSEAVEGAVLRLSWSGPVPLAIWAGNTDSYDGPYMNAVGRSGESELLRSTTARIDAVLVGFEGGSGLTLTEPVVFALTVEKR